MSKNKTTLRQYKFSLFVTIIASLTACQQVPDSATKSTHKVIIAKQETPPIMSDKEKEIVAKLQWVKTASASEDAHKALAEAGSDKVEIIAFSGRGRSFPGLTAEQYTEIEDLVSYRFAKGSGDTLYGPTQKSLRKQMNLYAREYNKIIYKALTKSK